MTALLEYFDNKSFQKPWYAPGCRVQYTCIKISVQCSTVVRVIVDCC